MRLGIFTTTTRSVQRGDNFQDAFDCYKDIADVVTIIDGEETWPQEFSWPLIGEHFQKGYEECDADWVIHADLDFIFHEESKEEIRKACELYSDEPALSFWKLQFISPDRYNLKSRLVIAVNKKKFGNRIRFDSGGDLCQPSLDGSEIEERHTVQARIPFFNYEKLTKTKEQIADDVGRMDRAWHRIHGKYMYGSDGTDESAFDGWLHMMYGRYQKPQKGIPLDKHPIFIQETIRNLRPDQFGYNGFEYFKNDYIKET